MSNTIKAVLIIMFFLIVLGIYFYAPNIDRDNNNGLSVGYSQPFPVVNENEIEQAKEAKILPANKNQTVDFGEKPEEDGFVDCEECNDADDEPNSDIPNFVVNTPISAKDVQIIPRTIKDFSVVRAHEVLDNLLESEPIDQPWATSTESSINEIFRDAKNNEVLTESNLDYVESECHTTVCGITFIPTAELDPKGRMRQLLSLTSFFDQSVSLSEAQTYTQYTDDGRLIVKLLFND